jgi:hypothetical protein
MTSSIDPALNTPPTEINNEPSWWISDGNPGQGERPDWLPEKFKSVSDVAKSYSELEKRVGSAPKDYDLSKAESWIDPDYAPFQEMMQFAKEKHVSQDVFDKVLDSVTKYLDEFNVDYNEERAKLGDKVDERLGVLDNWAKSNFSEDTYNALSNSIQTADGIKALEEVRNKMNSNATVIPNTNLGAQADVPSLQDIQSELNNNLTKYKTDPAYRRELQAKMELASKNSGFEEKRAY